MERLWAPWRMSYIQGIDKNPDGCVFCDAPARSVDRDTLILHRATHAFVIMNLYPYNNGHLMVVPYAHLSSIEKLTPETSAEMWVLAQRCVRVLTQAFRPDGHNIGMNLGRTAGAGIDQHLHLHVVPRWNGDANFMSVVGETKVISQGLGETYDALAPGFAAEG